MSSTTRVQAHAATLAPRIAVMILYCPADLVWATRIKSTAESVGVPARPARNPDMLRARLGDSPVKALILDLDAPEASLELLRELRGDATRPPLDPEHRVLVVAFGPHVAADLFRQAKSLGADAVLARGAFHRRLPELLTELERGGEASPAISDDVHD